MINRPALRYFGGKWRLAPWIISHFPEHSCYCEPFAGAASVLLRKKPSLFEYYNDADGRVVNFFRILRDRRKDLDRLLSLTPFSREELTLSEQRSADPLEDARRLYVLMWQGRGAHESSTGWRYQRMARARNKTVGSAFIGTEHLASISRRLRQVGIEHDDAFAVLRRYDGDETLFYVDPPYLAASRSKASGRYAREFNTEPDHVMLLALLSTLQAHVVLSHPQCETYAANLPGWQVHTRPHLTGSSRRTEEALWLNPRCAAAQLQGELPLFPPAT